MAAEGLPAGQPVWELEAWYQDLQEVLAAAEPGAPSLPWGAEQAELALPWGVAGAGSSAGGRELDAALATELFGPESSAGAESAVPLCSASSESSPPQGGAPEEDEEAAAGQGVKRKRCGGVVASRELAKPRERAHEQRVLELTAHNERLRAEIRRLSAEVESARAALIDRAVNAQRASTLPSLGREGSHELQQHCPAGTD